MKIVQETTRWTDNVANNLYLVTDNMEYIVAYVPQGSTSAQRFKKPIRWDSRGRTFKILKEIAENDANSIVVEGSKGQRYTLTRANGTWSCTCPGYAYRGNCRHVAEKV
jgi:uncharacterized Zn finger protein